MELLTKNVYLNSQKGRIITQITLENDFNVSDINPDVEDIITETGSVKIDGVKIFNGKAEITGRLVICILYLSGKDKGMPSSMEMEIPFVEPVNMDMLQDGDTVRVDYEIDDVKIRIINSRKISVKAIISFKLDAESIYSMEIGLEPKEKKDSEYIRRQFRMMQIFSKKGDVYRVKEEVELSGGKPNIGNILWKNVDVRNCQTRLMENKISLTGEIALFIIYTPEEDNLPIQWVDSLIHFSGVIDCEGCNEEMIQDIIVTPMEINVDIKPDYDGEQRILEVDAVLGLDMRVYEEDSMDILLDIYSPTMELVTEKKNATGERIVMKNNSKCKITDKVEVDTTKGRILQICNTSGKVSIDEITKVENGINIEGALEVTILYISGNDNRPFCSEKALIPFTHTVDVNGIYDNMEFNVKHGIEQLNSVMISENEVEVKVVAGIDVTVFCKVDEPVIVNITEQEPNIEELKKMPGIVIYRADAGENLWAIAKKYHTTVSSLKELNGITEDELAQGQSVLVVKMV